MNKEEKLEIYEYDKSIKSLLTRIEKDNKISNNNKKHVVKFYEFCSAEGLSKARLEYYLNRLLVIGRLAKKDFKKMNKTDVVALVNQINNLKLADQSKSDYRGTFKKFLSG